MPCYDLFRTQAFGIAAIAGRTGGLLAPYTSLVVRLSLCGIMQRLTLLLCSQQDTTKIRAHYVPTTLSSVRGVDILNLRLAITAQLGRALV